MKHYIYKDWLWVDLLEIFLRDQFYFNFTIIKLILFYLILRFL